MKSIKPDKIRLVDIDDFLDIDEEIDSLLSKNKKKDNKKKKKKNKHNKNSKKNKKSNRKKYVYKKHVNKKLAGNDNLKLDVKSKIDVNISDATINNVINILVSLASKIFAKK